MTAATGLLQRFLSVFSSPSPQPSCIYDFIYPCLELIGWEGSRADEFVALWRWSLSKRVGEPEPFAPPIRNGQKRRLIFNGDSSSSTERMRLNLFICAALFGVTLAIYWPARQFGINYLDDLFFLNLDPSIGLNRHGMAWALTAVVVANWHPITLFSFLVTHRFGGINPGVEHIVNVVFHAVNAVLLFLVLVKMTCLRDDSAYTEASADMSARQTSANTISETGGTPVLRRNIWLCAFVAGIFAWHPLRVESVAWIAERKDVLFTFFMFLALLCYVEYAQEKRKWPQKNAENAKENQRQAGRPSYWYTLALVFFILSFMSKAMVVTLPFLLLLLDFWPLKRLSVNAKCGARSGPSPHPNPLPSHQMGAERGQPSNKNRVGPKAGRMTGVWLVAEKIPFFALMLVFCAVTYRMQKTTGAVSTLQEIGIAGRLENATLSYVNYLGNFFWPTNLTIIYPFPKSFDGIEVTLCAVLLLAISALCMTEISRRPYLAAGWFWYLGTMVPVIGLVNVGGLEMADRYTYVPLIGPVISLAWLVSEWVGAVRSRKLLSAIAAVVLLTLCVVLTRMQLMYWQNNFTLFEHAAEVSPVNSMTQMALASGLAEKGRFREAAVHYQIAAKLVPGDYLPAYYLAIYLRNNGFQRQALAEYQVVASDGCNPNDSFADMNLADALTRLGRYSEAVNYLETVLRANPNSTEAMNNLAWILATCPDANVRDGARAVELGERACELTNHKQTIFIGTLAAANAEAGRFDDAASTAKQAIALAKQHGETTLQEKNEELLRLYQAHKAFHEPGPALAPN
jgi:Flp pilus assembly protein TadD